MASKPKSSAYPKELKTLGDHIRKRRLDLNLLQRDVAERIGAEVTSVVNWEKGRGTPELRFLPAILAFLGHDPRPKPTTIPDQLVAFREGKGWTQAHFARVLGFDPTTLARWERGEKQPIGEYRKRVEKVLGDA